MSPLCGQPARGGPCRLRVSAAGERCRFHAAGADDGREKLKARIIELLEAGQHTEKGAARQVGVNPVTVWRWKQADPEFAQRVQDIDGDPARLSRWESSLFIRVMNGKAAAGLEIFWAVNVSNRVDPGRWRNIQQVVHANIDANLANLPDAALQRIASGEDAVRVIADTLHKQPSEAPEAPEAGVLPFPAAGRKKAP